MKISLNIIILLSCAVLSANDKNLGDLRSYIAVTESTMPEDYRRIPAAIVDNLDSLNKYESYVLAQDIIKQNWESIAPEIDAIADTDAKRAILFNAAQEALEPDEYISLVTQCIEGRDSNAINYWQFKWALFPWHKKHRNMWAPEYASVPMFELARKAEELFASSSSPSTADFFRRYLNEHKTYGDAAKLDALSIEVVEEQELLMPEEGQSDASQLDQTEGLDKDLADVKRDTWLIWVLVVFAVVLVVILLARKSKA